MSKFPQQNNSAWSLPKVSSGGRHKCFLPVSEFPVQGLCSPQIWSDMHDKTIGNNVTKATLSNIIQRCRQQTRKVGQRCHHVAAHLRTRAGVVSTLISREFPMRYYRNYLLCWMSFCQRLLKESCQNWGLMTFL